jgi:hypothetical protein
MSNTVTISILLIRELSLIWNIWATQLPLILNLLTCNFSNQKTTLHFFTSNNVEELPCQTINVVRVYEKIHLRKIVTDELVPKQASRMFLRIFGFVKKIYIETFQETRTLWNSKHSEVMIELIIHCNLLVKESDIMTTNDIVYATHVGCNWTYSKSGKWSISYLSNTDSNQITDTSYLTVGFSDYIDGFATDKYEAFWCSV